ncbi:pilus assembly protein TadG-related protein [Vibrio fluvialis]|uniref:pilus assembly protein TadG-related protein n=1 Tax=Vibrio fluvialis TaxID=676 RepID=UPI001302D7CD|nr:pilus assembly protein TadG-related protein [Vibrio fluvialis]
MKTQRPLRGIRKQRGLVVVIVTIALLLLIAVAAFAIDINHALMNRTKLQNSVDAAALAAAVVLDKDGTEAQADAMARATLTKMSTSAGNSELVFDVSDTANIQVQFSNDPIIFPASTYSSSPDADRYVRVVVNELDLESFFFAKVMGVTKRLSASAVAGPSPGGNACNIVPMAVCEGDDAGTNGYDAGVVYALKIADQSDPTMGSGNFQLLDFGSGASTVRDALAGGYEGCVDLDAGETVDTKPGNTVGPVGQGLNTRFGDYSGGGLSATDYPPDLYVKQTSPTLTDSDVGSTLAWGYDDYQSDLAGGVCPGDTTNCKANGDAERRILAIPIVDCSGATGGTNSFSVTAIGCFFLLQKAPNSNGGHTSIFGEFIEDCTVKNTRNNGTNTSNGPHRIVLYKDPNSEES